MKVSFGNYSYYNPNDNSDVPTGNAINKYKFDSRKFNQLIANRQYQDAADYASQFHFDDPATQRAHENDILNLRREGRKIGAIYGSLNKDQLNQVSFLDAVFVDNGLETLNNNPIANTFINAKQKLFEGIAPVGTDHNAQAPVYNYLSFRLEDNGKKTVAGIDWMAKDNDATTTNFYKLYGYSEAQLKSAGINVIHKDGYTYLNFSGDNKLANKLIYDISKFAIDDTSEGYDSTMLAQTNDINDTPTFPGFGNSYLETIKATIDGAKNTKDVAFTNLDLATKDYSSTVGPSLDDNLEVLNQMLASGQITQQEYNQQRKVVGSILDQAIRSLGSGNYEMFSNAYNENLTDETLVSLSNEQRSEIIQSISAANPKSLHFNAMVSNGQIGTLVTIDADEVSEQKISDDDDRNKVKRRRRQVFIPGFMSEVAQEKINRNTSSRAIQEINDMQDYGYAFKTTDGQEIYSSMDGKFYIDGQEISKDVATKAINKTMIIEDATTNLKYQFTNKTGDMYDTEGYEQMARMIAVKAANDLNPNVSFGDNVTVEDIFNKKGAGPTVSDEYASNMQYELYNKYQDVFDIYDKIMAAIINNN